MVVKHYHLLSGHSNLKINTMSGKSVTKVITRDVGTPLWFTVLMAILAVIAVVSIIALAASTTKIKKGQGYGMKGTPVCPP